MEDCKEVEIFEYSNAIIFQEKLVIHSKDAIFMMGFKGKNDIDKLIGKLFELRSEVR